MMHNFKLVTAFIGAARGIQIEPYDQDLNRGSDHMDDIAVVDADSSFLQMDLMQRLKDPLDDEAKEAAEEAISQADQAVRRMLALQNLNDLDSRLQQLKWQSQIGMADIPATFIAELAPLPPSTEAEVCLSLARQCLDEAPDFYPLAKTYALRSKNIANRVCQEYDNFLQEVSGAIARGGVTAAARGTATATATAVSGAPAEFVPSQSRVQAATAALAQADAALAAAETELANAQEEIPTVEEEARVAQEERIGAHAALRKDKSAWRQKDIKKGNRYTAPVLRETKAKENLEECRSRVRQARLDVDNKRTAAATAARDLELARLADTAARATKGAAKSNGGPTQARGGVTAAPRSAAAATARSAPPARVGAPTTMRM